MKFEMPEMDVVLLATEAIAEVSMGGNTGEGGGNGEGGDFGS